MKSVSRKLLVAAIGTASMLSLPLLGGCEVHDHGHYVAASHGDTTYVYQPGYYYDNDYYDHDGHYHNRAYYYYDGHHWDHRDAVPSGYTAHERHELHEQHARHEEHQEHDVN